MQSLEPRYSTADTGAVVVLESFGGSQRDAVVERWLSEAEEAGARTWRLQCTPEIGGVWAGLSELVESVVTDAEKSAPDLLRKHAYEVGLTLPARQGSLEVVRSLTDLASPEEQTRNYAADRSYRSLHGLIDLLAEWYAVGDGRPWAIACEDFDRANGLVRRFFRELNRRRAELLGLQLLVTVAPARADDVVGEFPPAQVLRHEIEGDEPAASLPDPAEMTQLAVALEAEMKGREAETYPDLPRLVHYWRHSTEPEKALNWQIAAMSTLNHLGLYEAGLEMADDVEAYLARGPEGDPERYGRAAYGFYLCLVPLGINERARRVTEAALPQIPELARPSAYYLVSMLYARFLEAQDLEKAKDYLQQALDLVAVLDIPEHERDFQTVFFLNGLALVRVRERRPQEALELCQSGLERLNSTLDPSEHRLHRSVLLYNIAQVYAQIGPFDKALEAFAQTMEMDPNYSEYHNERGAVYFKLERYDEAEDDYLTAIQLSPPYAEVWVNLGQLYRVTERMAEAVAAYSRALDLDPTVGLAWAGRADAYATLGEVDAALADYDKALEVDESDAMVFAGRALLRYEEGDVNGALADLDKAVELAPDLGELHQNRAVARQDLGMNTEAAADLDRYLQLCPDAEDRAEVEEQLEGLLASAG
ncbi:MAG TPA: tetratricopeptide repeat protein [Acidimicrobiales bacterium]|nr:tetratricopeptide repeat protein [Acidimicrobiales bacterium]